MPPSRWQQILVAHCRPPTCPSRARPNLVGVIQPHLVAGTCTFAGRLRAEIVLPIRTLSRPSHRGLFGQRSSCLRHRANLAWGITVFIDKGSRASSKIRKLEGRIRYVQTACRTGIAKFWANFIAEEETRDASPIRPAPTYVIPVTRTIVIRRSSPKDGLRTRISPADQSRPRSATSVPHGQRRAALVPDHPARGARDPD